MLRQLNQSKTQLKIILALFILFCSPSFAQKLLVHPDNNIFQIPQNKLRAIYSMRTRIWPDGTPITVFILNADSEAHRSFCVNKLQLFPYQLQRVWDVMVYSGTGQSPIELSSEAEMLSRLSHTPGAIGYILELGVPDNVKIINIEK